MSSVSFTGESNLGRGESGAFDVLAVILSCPSPVCKSSDRSQYSRGSSPSLSSESTTSFSFPLLLLLLLSDKMPSGSLC